MTSEDIPVDPTIDPDIVPPGAYQDREVVGELTDTPVGFADEPDGPDLPPEIDLTEDERHDLASLMTVGRRLKTITVMGHKVKIRSLNVDDELRIGLFTKPYLESQGFGYAYRLAVAASGVVEIGGNPIYSSLRQITDPDEMFDKHVEKLREYFPVVVDQIYQAVLGLDKEFTDLAIKLGLLGKPAG